MARMSSKLRKTTKRIRKGAVTVAQRREIRSDETFRPQGAVEVIVNFPDGKMNLYQIRQWYGPLEELARTRSVAILCYRPETARQISQETSVQVLLTPSFTDLSEVADVIDPKIILYPNQNYSNYRILAHTRAKHVFICHGESDKIYMASNWVKAFDYFFVAGDASRERLSRHVRNYDVAERTIPIGRPQIDVSHQPPIAPVPDRTTVLYAPTWEGGRATMRYGSVASHGREIVRSLLADDDIQLIYRPHPRTGVQLRRTKAANRRLKRRIRRAASLNPEAGHMVDTTPFGWQLDYADFMITDISAVAYDWLSTGKPLLVTRPVEPLTPLAESGYMANVPLLDARDFRNEEELAADAEEATSGDAVPEDLDDEGGSGDSSSDDAVAESDEGVDTFEDAVVDYEDATPASSYVSTLVRTMLDDDTSRAQQREWADYYYGDRTPGASMARWIAAIDRVIDERDAAVDNARCVDLGTRPRWRDKIGHYVSTLETIVVGQLSPAKTAANDRTKLAIAAGRTADVVVASMAPPDDARSLFDWLPALEALHRSASVAIIVGDIRTYQLLRNRTGLQVLFTKNAVTSEQLTDTLHPSLGLQFDQAKLNLRETTYRYMTHAFVGDRTVNTWVNNRLRVFDVVLSPMAATTDLISETMMDIPPTIDVRTINDTGSAPHRAAVLATLVRETQNA